MKGEIDDKELKKIREALIKKATGYVCEEVIKEYSIDDNGDEHLLKKKVSKKYIPADLSAIKMLVEMFSENEYSYADMSDVELDKEAVKLFKEYQQLSNIDLVKELKGENNEIGRDSSEDEM